MVSLSLGENRGGRGPHVLSEEAQARDAQPGDAWRLPVGGESREEICRGVSATDINESNKVHLCFRSSKDDLSDPEDIDLGEEGGGDAK